MNRIILYLFLFLSLFSHSQNNQIDSIFIASRIKYSKDLKFIDLRNNELEFYDLKSIQPFFEKLKLSGKNRVSVLHMGDSHIQYDQGPGVIRNTFQEIFGYAGRGFVFPYAAAGTHAAFDYKTSKSGKWQGSRNVSKEIDFPLGISGATAHTEDSTAGFKIEFYQPKDELEKVNKINLFVKKSDSSFHLKYRLSDLDEWKQVDLSPSVFNSDKIEIQLSQNFKTSLEIQVEKTDSVQKEFELYGIQLENTKQSGILYNSVGINGASLLSFLKQDLFVEQLKVVRPDLIILDYGTNDLAAGKFDSTYFINNLTKCIFRIKEVLPQSCILIPSIQDFTVNGKNISVVHEYSQFLKRFAKNQPVVLYDYYWVSGGKKSMKKWLNAGIAKSDQIHLTQQGYILKGELYGNAILNSFARYLSSPQEKVLFDRKPLEPVKVDTTQILDSIDSLKKDIKPIEQKAPKTIVEQKVSQTKDNSKSSKPEVVKPKKTFAHIVKKGETLSSISRKYGTTVLKLKAKNKLKSDNIKIGQKLLIP